MRILTLDIVVMIHDSLDNSVVLTPWLSTLLSWPPPCQTSPYRTQGESSQPNPPDAS